MSYATSNIICGIVFGSRFEYDDNEFTAMVLQANGNMKMLVSPTIQVLYLSSTTCWFYDPNHLASFWVENVHVKKSYYGCSPFVNSCNDLQDWDNLVAGLGSWPIRNCNFVGMLLPSFTTCSHGSNGSRLEIIWWAVLQSWRKWSATGLEACKRLLIHKCANALSTLSWSGRNS